jgi:hypothetical protein
VRIKNRNSRIQQLAALRQPQPRIEHHHLRTRVAAQHFACVFGLDRDYFLAGAVKDSCHVGEVVLAVRVGGRKTVDMLVQGGRVERIEAGVDLADFLLLRGCGFFFDNRLYFHLSVRAFADYPPISIRIVQIGAEHGHGRFLSAVEVAELLYSFGGDQRRVAGEHDHLVIFRERFALLP